MLPRCVAQRLHGLRTSARIDTAPTTAISRRLHFERRRGARALVEHEVADDASIVTITFPMAQMHKVSVGLLVAGVELRRKLEAAPRLGLVAALGAEHAEIVERARFATVRGRHRVAVARLGLVLAALAMQRQRYVGVHGTRQLRRQPRHGRGRVARQRARRRVGRALCGESGGAAGAYLGVAEAALEHRHERRRQRYPHRIGLKQHR